jgi:hypothetical protein
MQGFIRHSAQRRSRALRCLGVLAILIGPLQGCLPAGKERLGGYLTRVPPHELRFGSSPTVASLPPLPIIPDPQPVFDKLERLPEPPEFVKFPGRVSQTESPSPAIVINLSTNQQAKASNISIDSSLVSPQMLIRLFPTTAARTPEIEMLMNESIPFQPPALQRSSSAQYELK